MRASEFAYFLRQSLCFLLGLALILLACDRSIDYAIGRNRFRHVLGGEVWSAVQRSSSAGSQVRTVFLGDSVAHQLLTPGTEHDPAVRFLTANQAISVAGQCYLLENALRSFPHLSDAYLVYIPGCFGNNLPRELSHDYFCGYFHSPHQVMEVFAVKRDFDLSAAHVGRMLLPNLMMQNSMWQRTSRSVAPSTAGSGATFLVQAPPDAEPLLSLLTRWCAPEPEPQPCPAGSYGAALPPVSRYFLEKMRTDCRARGVRLHVLPCPLSTRETFADPQHVYDAPPLRVDPQLLIDPVHFRIQYSPQWRRRFIETYKLPLRQ